ncbi:hypothetical protein [Streptomyces longwoodensis]
MSRAPREYRVARWSHTWSATRNRPKTESTDEVLTSAEETEEQGSPAEGASGRTMREALEEAGVEPDDFEER